VAVLSWPIYPFPDALTSRCPWAIIWKGGHGRPHNGHSRDARHERETPSSQPNHTQVSQVKSHSLRLQVTRTHCKNDTSTPRIFWEAAWVTGQQRGPDVGYRPADQYVLSNQSARGERRQQIRTRILKLRAQATLCLAHSSRIPLSCYVSHRPSRCFETRLVRSESMCRVESGAAPTALLFERRPSYWLVAASLSSVSLFPVRGFQAPRT
jgi:hypothetical protein